MLTEIDYKIYISIHALVKRATLSPFAKFVPRDFNPRPREEGDYIFRDSAALSGDFNPRPREEGDYPFFVKNSSKIIFQSTPS